MEKIWIRDPGQTSRIRNTAYLTFILDYNYRFFTYRKHLMAFGRLAEIGFGRQDIHRALIQSGKRTTLSSFLIGGLAKAIRIWNLWLDGWISLETEGS
jgi:hypothetical protein